AAALVQVPGRQARTDIGRAALAARC
ncbi:MAG: hypothetical protein JWM98_1343, partial [Thermoleophilia bacterium]|nr:hypothetical protein [Thermoleophilia bacterium]